MPNRYELAVEDIEHLRKARTAITELTAWLDDKQTAAEAELAACELSPGIPLPRYQGGGGGLHEEPNPVPDFRDAVSSNVRDQASSNFRDGVNWEA